MGLWLHMLSEKQIMKKWLLVMWMSTQHKTEGKYFFLSVVIMVKWVQNTFSPEASALSLKIKSKIYDPFTQLCYKTWSNSKIALEQSEITSLLQSLCVWVRLNLYHAYTYSSCCNQWCNYQSDNKRPSSPALAFRKNIAR